MGKLSGRQILLLVGLGLALGAAILVVAVVWVDPLGTPGYVVNSGEAYFSPDEELGQVPRPGVVVRSTKHRAGEIVYDVQYTIDDTGLRHTPQSAPDGSGTLFFGGSFLFGEGLEDAETLPSRLAAVNPGRRTINAGFQGYGPHQMLRMLETDRLHEHTKQGVDDVVYLAIGNHVDRVGGRVFWNPGAPRYVLEGGSPRFVGPLHDGLFRLMLRIWQRVPLLRGALLGWLAPTKEQARQDRDLYVAVVAKSAALTREKWGASFTVIFWDHNGSELARELTTAGLDVILVSEALEHRRWSAFTIPLDGHPSAQANIALAHLLAEHWNRAALWGHTPSGLPGEGKGEKEEPVTFRSTQEFSGAEHVGETKPSASLTPVGGSRLQN